ncbi:MAG: hypothetical protein LBV77_07055 [Candidatus Adiutrix intracellularis]|nr:hypothetical protein [Candidatus Adiutrix intracellularis]
MYNITAATNTTMLQLLLDLASDSLNFTPFTLIFIRGTSFRGHEIWLRPYPNLSFRIQLSIKANSFY